MRIEIKFLPLVLSLLFTLGVIFSPVTVEIHYAARNFVVLAALYTAIAFRHDKSMLDLLVILILIVCYNNLFATQFESGWAWIALTCAALFYSCRRLLHRKS
jgi:hypothetical protein